MYNITMTDDYDIDDIKLADGITAFVNAFIKKYPHSEISIASFLFANAIRIWKEQLDEEDFHALLEEVTDSILYEEVDKRILH